MKNPRKLVTSGALKIILGSIMTHRDLDVAKAPPRHRGVRHYRLTNAEWLKAVKQLKPRERDVLYYLRTLDPWGDKDLNIGVRQIATDLECSPGTVSKALKVLDQKNWIDLEITAAKVRLRTDKPESDDSRLDASKDVFPPGNTVSLTKRTFPEGNICFLRETFVSSRKHLEARTIDIKEAQAALNSLNNQTNLNKEREGRNFDLEISQDYRDWLLAKASRLPDPPALRELWLEKQSVNPANLREYEAWQAVQKQRVSSPPPAPPEQPADPEEIDVPARLIRYQQQWSVPVMRKAIQNAIATHPDWGIEIGPDGPRWRLGDAEPAPEPQPEPEPDGVLVLQQVKGAIATQKPISDQLRADAERCGIDIPMLQAERELARKPRGFGAGVRRRAG